MVKTGVLTFYVAHGKQIAHPRNLRLRGGGLTGRGAVAPYRCKGCKPLHLISFVTLRQ